MTRRALRPQTTPFAQAHPAPEALLGMGVLFGWAVLVYLGLVWFRRLSVRDRWERAAADAARRAEPAREHQSARARPSAFRWA
jgi:hypothetical protein